MGPLGIEPISSLNRKEHPIRQDRTEAGQIQGLGKNPLTEPALPETQPNPTKTHNRPITVSTTDSTTDPDLRALVDAWPDLSPESKCSIAGIVKSEKQRLKDKKPE
jgi:hypothetical protein